MRSLYDLLINSKILIQFIGCYWSGKGVSRAKNVSEIREIVNLMAVMVPRGNADGGAPAPHDRRAVELGYNTGACETEKPTP